MLQIGRFSICVNQQLEPNQYHMVQLTHESSFIGRHHGAGSLLRSGTKYKAACRYPWRETKAGRWRCSLSCADGKLWLWRLQQGTAAECMRLLSSRTVAAWTPAEQAAGLLRGLLLLCTGGSLQHLLHLQAAKADGAAAQRLHLKVDEPPLVVCSHSVGCQLMIRLAGSSACQVDTADHVYLAGHLPGDSCILGCLSASHL